MSERRKPSQIDYDTNIDVISKGNSEPVCLSPKSYKSGSNLSNSKSFQSAKDFMKKKPVFNDSLYQSYMLNKHKQKTQ